MLRKLHALIFLCLLLTVPMVSANPITDFFKRLFGDIGGEGTIGNVDFSNYEQISDTSWKRSLGNNEYELLVFTKPNVTQSVSIQPTFRGRSIETEYKNYSESTDGHLNIDDITGCTSASSASTTQAVGDNNLLTLQSWAYFNFNTSEVPDTATINSFEHYVYSHDMPRNPRTPPANFWVFNYYSDKIDYSTLACGDQNKITTFAGTLDWGGDGSEGWEIMTLATSFVNKTGMTAIEITPNFEMVEASDDGTAFWRAREYTGELSDPYVKVIYTEASVGVCTNNYVDGDFIVSIDEKVNCSQENFNITGKVEVAGYLNWNQGNININQSIENFVNKTGRWMINETRTNLQI